MGGSKWIDKGPDGVMQRTARDTHHLPTVSVIVVAETLAVSEMRVGVGSESAGVIVSERAVKWMDGCRIEDRSQNPERNPSSRRGQSQRKQYSADAGLPRERSVLNARGRGERSQPNQERLKAPGFGRLESWEAELSVSRGERAVGVQA
ncbi:hypothetical protein C8R44DRAFT_751494 [Mycena epipterygia]|nr:hypothetical protein C8R44DRAFT_751494 [Mycena epipterygia]